MNTEELTQQIQREYAADAYTCYHAPRYAVLLALARGFVGESSTVLDIGRSELTVLSHRHLGVSVDTLGFTEDQPTPTGKHYRFDLNSSQSRDTWRAGMPRYDLVLMAEVIEHLYTSPKLVLEFLRSLLRPSGVLIIQTPNALSLTKRVKAVLGIHPYERIREDTTNPGHFREYTAGELRQYARAADLEVVLLSFHNYFDLRYNYHTGATTPPWLDALKFRFLDLLPGFLKPGITLVLRAPQ